MKIKTFVMLLLAPLLILTLMSTVFAANWVYVLKDSTFGATDYIDTDSVIKTDDGVIFWLKTVWDYPLTEAQKITLERYEVKLLNPRWYRTVEHYNYDSSNKETDHYTLNNSAFFSIEHGTNLDRDIEAALQYAKLGQDNSSFGPNWFYVTTDDSKDLNKAGGYYVDYDSIVQKGELLIFRYKIWLNNSLTNTNGANINSIIYKYAANPTVGKGSILESYGYDSKGQEIYSHDKPADEFESYQGSTLEKVVQFALKYIKGGTSQNPTPQNGQGVYVWANGDRYEGEWKDGQENGKGVFTWANGDRYEGDFAAGKKTGKGILTWIDGTRYEGDCVDGIQTGKGTCTWVDGTRYEGDWVNNKQNGKGVCSWPNGVRYDGDWVDGNMNGYGTCYFPNGAIERGQWSNGKFIQGN